MAVTLKPNTEITVPKSIRRKAGFKPGDRVEFRVAGRSITIVPKLSADELEDEREVRDPKIRAIIQEGYKEFLAGKSRPARALLAEITAQAKAKKSGRQTQK
jgi:AbrB family looped-hinge helix DNA binding protein